MSQIQTVSWHRRENLCAVSRFVPLPQSYINKQCPRCDSDQLVGAIIVNEVGLPVVVGTDDADPNIYCKSCGWSGDSIGD